MQVWLAMDPQTGRIMAQQREFGEGDFPAGARGLDWPIRVHPDVDDQRWADLLDGKLTPVEQTALHRELWAAAS